MQQLFPSYISVNNHAESDYFGLIKELVRLRKEKAPGSVEYKNAQESIDAVYDLVMDELLTNQGPPNIPVTFGTSGWRGILGKDLFVASVGFVTAGIVEMYRALERDPEQEFVDALGVNNFEEARSRGCVVGFDNRFGGAVLAEEVIRVLTANGIKVYYAGESTTGALSASLLQLGAAFSINLTPSHNPLEYGGFKYNAADGGPAAAILTNRITANARDLISGNKPSGDLQSKTPIRAEICKIDALQLWIEFVKANKARHGLDYEAIMKQLAATDDIVVAVDCVHGASRLHMKKFFGDPPERILVLLRDVADPTFGGIAPEPSLANMRPVMNLLTSRPESLKIGAIIDPDGDRVRFTDGENEISMNQFGAMAFHYLNTVKKKNGLLAKTVATSNFANAIASALGMEIFEPRVGFKEFKPVIGRALICFEESDGISTIGHTPEKDAYIGLLLALDMVLTLKKNLGEYLHELEAQFGYFFPASAGVVVSTSGGELQKKLVKLERYKNGSIVQVGNITKTIVQVIDVDGRKMIMEDGSWIMIRPSGTEPKVRFYVESRSASEKNLLLESAENMLREIGLVSS